MANQAADKKYYPYWEEVYRLFKDSGLNFACDYDAANNHPVMQVNFHNSADLYRAMEVIRQADYDQNIIYDWEVNDEDEPAYLWIDQLPNWLPVPPDELKKLLGDVRAFLQKHREEVVQPLFDDQEDEDDAAFFRVIDETMFDLINRIEKVQHNG